MLGMVITDDKEKRIHLGKKFDKIFYKEKEKKDVWDMIERFEKEQPLEKKEESYYLSIYDYWAFGVSTVEYYYYKFYEKNAEEKAKYLTFRNRTDYYYHMNDKEESHTFNNKWETYLKYKEYYKRDAMLVQNENDYDNFLMFINRHSEFVVKPVSLGLAIGVYKEKSDKYDDTKKLFLEILSHGKEMKNKNDWKDWDDNTAIMLEEIIPQTQELGVIHPVSINAVRITTIRNKNGVEIFYPWWLVGQGGDFVVGGAVGSILAGINPKTGIVETDGVDESLNTYVIHPNTKIKFKGFEIPHWTELVSIAKELAMNLDNVGHVGWDFAYTDKGWMMMEANFDGEFCGQLVYHKPIKEELENIIDWKCDKEFWWEK